MRIYLTLLILFINATAHAGQTYNPFTGKFDKCITMEEIDGSPSSPVCGKMKVSNGALTDNGDGTFTLTTGVGGGGDVSGPASSVDNAIPRFDGTGGKTIQDYTSNAPTITDAGIMTVDGSVVRSPATKTIGSSVNDIAPNSADKVVDGTDDHSEINTAITEMVAGSGVGASIRS